MDKKLTLAEAFDIAHDLAAHSKDFSCGRIYAWSVTEDQGFVAMVVPRDPAIDMRADVMSWEGWVSLRPKVIG